MCVTYAVETVRFSGTKNMVAIILIFVAAKDGIRCNTTCHCHVIIVIWPSLPLVQCEPPNTLAHSCCRIRCVYCYFPANTQKVCIEACP